MKEEKIKLPPDFGKDEMSKYRLSDIDIEKGISLLLEDKPELLGACLDAIYRDVDGFEAAEEFHRRHMTPSCGVITVYNKQAVSKIMNQIAEQIEGKTVIEIGAGVGMLAIAMANIADKVYAIESDPAWSWAFTKILYDIKPPNLTFIFGKAESVIKWLKGDVAVVVTRSGTTELRALASKFAPVVIMPR